MLMLAIPGGGAFRLGRGVKVVCRCMKDYSILWLLLLLWTSGMFLCVTILTAILAKWVPFRDDSVWIVLTLPLAAAGFGVIGYVFGLSISRCIGLFGRYNPFIFRK